MFYEDVPRRPWLLLSWVLPQPRGSRGDKSAVGSPVRCSYDRGFLVKRATLVEPARRLHFEVVEQALGIERYARAKTGSYELEATSAGTRVTLTTKYNAQLRPRFLWRPIERYVCHQVHRHILLGMRERVAEFGALNPAPSGTAAAPSR